MADISTLKGEKIIEEIKPLPQLKKYLFITRLYHFIFYAIFMTIFIFIISNFFFHSNDAMRNTTSSLVIPFAILAVSISIAANWKIARKSYEIYQYWLTNKRIVIKSGLIGFQIKSIPYNKISDVIISKTLFEELTGISSLIIQSLAGQAGIEGYLPALPNPEETQSKILKYAKIK